ncbi:MAG: hypothetical protein P4M04_11405 [Acidobacteriota bacterium]|nr:hypothetical protein [Acidobacteriota bacterium]
MIIIGVDFHPEFQQIAWVDTASGELQETRLQHREEAENFYRELARRAVPVRVGMEASGHARWFERLMGELRIELWIGDAAEIRTKRVRKQKKPRAESEFRTVHFDSTEYAFEKDSVVMFCRPCHENGFVRETILRALNCGVRAIVYVGLDSNVKHDLGRYYREFTKRRIRNIGHADERIWEKRVGRLQAAAYLRRGAIPPLVPSFL